MAVKAVWGELAFARSRPRASRFHRHDERLFSSFYDLLVTELVNQRLADRKAFALPGG
jgi:hypothetical protein